MKKLKLIDWLFILLGVLLLVQGGVRKNWDNY